MDRDNFQEFDCDLCGSDDAAEIEIAPSYTDGQPIHVCTNCGFVYVRKRRSASEIAETWSEDIFCKGYTAHTPAVRARHVYVAEFINEAIGIEGKTLCDIGGGEGLFADLVRKPNYGAQVFAIEPSPVNCQSLADLEIDAFKGTIEDYVANLGAGNRTFDIVTLLWTLENCQSCRGMLEAAYDALGDGGHIVVATGSRILVPFKKPLHLYLSANWADTHCFRFSANTLQGLMAINGFRVTHVNRYIDTDHLVMIGRKTEKSQSLPWHGDDHRAVVDFFRRWHDDTQAHFPKT